MSRASPSLTDISDMIVPVRRGIAHLLRRGPAPAQRHREGDGGRTETTDRLWDGHSDDSARRNWHARSK
jgi:hypothetical protein